MATADVTVMGAGIFGLSVAYALATRGAAVAVVDRAGPGAGSSGGLVGALAPHTPERWESKKEFQFQSLVMSETFWSGVDELSGKNSGYGRVGRLQPISNEHTLGLARERIAQADELWRGRAIWAVQEVGDFVGWVPPSPTGLVVYDTLSARISPRGATASLVKALTGLGVEFRSSAKASGTVIWATGYEGLLALSDELGTEMGNGVKGQSILLAYDRSNAPQIFSDGVHFVPHFDGTLAIGSTSERYFDDAQSVDEQLDVLFEKALNILPQLRAAPILERWAGVRPRAKTRAPMIGAHPRKPGEFIANGGFKIGLGMAPKVAEVLADLVLEGVDAIPDEFRVEANL